MALTILDRTITSDRTPHAARRATDQPALGSVLAPGPPPDPKPGHHRDGTRRRIRPRGRTRRRLGPPAAPHPGMGSRARHDRRSGHTPDHRPAGLGRRCKGRSHVARPRGRRMSQPRHAKQGDVPRAVPPPTRPATPPAPDDERVAGRRRDLQAVPDPLPTPEPEEPATSATYGRIVCQLTPFELSLYVQGDPDFHPGERSP